MILVMELHWDYDYYQSWTDNEWMRFSSGPPAQPKLSTNSEWS